MACVLSLPMLSSIDYTAAAGPYGLHNFLPIGTLVVAVSSLTHSCPEHWHAYYAQCIKFIRTEDDQILRILDFLTLHRFVAATCRIGAGISTGTHQLYVRIYLIPHDLANVEGVLRRRDEALILGPARRYLRALLSRVTRDAASWQSQAHVSSPDDAFYQADSDDRTLAEIYNDLPSPVVREPSHNSQEKCEWFAHEVLECPIRGMRTKLHQYQRRSVAAMAQREMNPDTVLDPLYIPVQGVDGRVFYMQPATMEVLQSCPTISRNRGGILCEELGTGKTVMILALVLVTIDHLPAPEESILDPRPVLTPLALRCFPSEPFIEARQRLTRGNVKRKEVSPTPQIPSLVETLLHYSRSQPGTLSIRHNFDNFPLKHLWRAYRRNAPFYHHYEEEPFEVLRTSRKKNDGGPKKMYLTSATLIVVPPNLLNQWANEINKHCDDSLVVYVVTERSSLPSARQLATSFDIILMTHARLAHEATKMNTESLYSWKSCQCPVPPDSSARVPDCQCKPPPNVSPLLQIRWKRLVIDEGHVLATTNTNLMTFIKSLSVERKWVVTGTPTTNMMGLRFGEGRDEMSADSNTELISDALQKKILRGSEDLSNDDDSDGDDRLDLEFADNDELQLVYPEEEMEVMAPLDEGYHDVHSRPVRRWTSTDRTDLTKLGNMIGSFLEEPQFAADAKLFQTHVIFPLMDPSGPRYGSVQVVTQVMQSVMIRHRIEDIEKEVSLPPMRQETILLDLDPYAVMTYNIMQATIVINAVDSERTGQDYFFHAINSTFLQQLIENISQAMFWHVDELAFNIDEIIAETPNFLETSSQKLASGKIPQSDFDMLVKALQLVQTAAQDPVWRSLQMHPNVFNRVYNMPSPIYKAWSILPSSLGQLNDTYSTDAYYLVIPDRLKTLRGYLIKKPLSSVPRIIQYGEIEAEQERARYRFNLSRARVNKGLRNLKKRRDQISKVGSGRADMNATAAARKDSMAKILEAQDKLKALLSEADENVTIQPSSNLHRMSPLAGVTIGNSTSSKLNYILNEVRLYASTAKFLIFSKSPLTLLYIAEAFAVMGVQYKLSSQKPVKVIEQDVLTFESSDTFRVFLMELKHGSRGLNLVTASRVIFCEPVWQADVETQAIKRVHRIGQTSPVVVKTLAIRSTAEDFMVKRREDLKRGLGSAGGKLPNLADDISMRNFIANPTFLPDPPPPTIILNFPLLPSSGTPPPPTHRLQVFIESPVHSSVPTPSASSSPAPSIRVVDAPVPSCSSTTIVDATPPPPRPAIANPSQRFVPTPIPVPFFDSSLLSGSNSSTRPGPSSARVEITTGPTASPAPRKMPRIPALITKRKTPPTIGEPFITVQKRVRIWPDDHDLENSSGSSSNPSQSGSFPQISVPSGSSLTARDQPVRGNSRNTRVRFASP